MQFIDLKKQYALVEHEILASIRKVLDHGQYIMGPEIKVLENTLSEFVGVSHTVVNASGTDALLMALLALDVSAGDEVITSPFSFFATVEVILLLGAKPVFVDIEPATYNLDPSKLEVAITPKTKVIMPVSLYGQPANMTAINEIAKQYALAVLEDAAQSFGAKHHGRYSGGLSTIGATSFFPSKPLGGYGDSGACFTNDPVLALRLEQIRIHGQSARYSHARLGINGRMDTIQAAILLEKLKLFSDEIRLREAVANRYAKLLKGVVDVPFISSENESVYGQYTIEVSNREQFIQSMQALGIPTAVHYPIPMHLQPLMHDAGFAVGDFPYAEAAAKRVVSLPMHPYLTISDQEQIVSAVKSSLHCKVSA